MYACCVCVYEDAYGTTNAAFDILFTCILRPCFYEDPPIIIVMTQTDAISQQINNQRHVRR